MTTLKQLDAAFNRCREQEFTCFVSFYGTKVRVTLTKASYNGSNNLAMDVKGEGDSVSEAFEAAFRNFPQNPLDGVSKWASKQLPVVEIVDNIKDTF